MSTAMNPAQSKGIVGWVVKTAMVTVLLAAWNNPVCGAEVTDDQLKLIRSQIFEETSHDNPQTKLDDIDDAFLTGLYSKPGALGAVQRLFISDAYKNINEKIGQLRHKANLETWSQVISETGVSIELNNAGKKNGSISDLDNATIILSEALVNQPEINTPEKVRDYLLGRHEQLWSKRFPGTTPASFDIAHFPGPKTDWRMSKSHWIDFDTQLKSDIIDLFGQHTYFSFGAYKPQVYGRYITEGELIRIEPSLDAINNPEKMKTPDGVLVSNLVSPVVTTQNLSTRKHSVAYKRVPINVDRTGVLESVIHNFFWSELYSENTIKNAKYGVRKPDSVTVGMTNLQVPFTRLVLEGRTDAIKHFVNKLYGEVNSKGLLPPEIGSLAEFERVLVTQVRLEQDKVLRSKSKSDRPDSWSEEWRNYESTTNFDDPKQQLRFFEAEVAELKKANPEDSPFFKNGSESQLLEMAKDAFLTKSRAVSRVSAFVAAKKVFTDVFTKDGFARLRELYPDELSDVNKARSLLSERVRSLHAAMVFLGDEAMLKNIVDAAPTEAKPVVEQLVSIARRQRLEIAGNQTIYEAYKKGEAEFTSRHLDSSDEVLGKLMTQLGIAPESVGRLQNGSVDPAALRKIEFSDRDYARRFNNLTLYQEAIRQRADRKQASGFFHTDLSATGLFTNTVDSFKDIGTADTMLKVMNALAKNDRSLAQKEAVEGIIENVPLFGDQYYKLLKALMEAQQGQYGGLAVYTGMNGLKLASGAFPTWALEFRLLSSVFTIYMIEKQLIDFGWTTVGKPNQDEFVMLALWGDPEPYLQQNPPSTWRWGGSRYATFEDGPKSTMKDIAILKNFDPDYPPILQEMNLKARFRVTANKLATSKIGTQYVNRWAKERDDILQKYYDNGGYWIRRMLLYYFIDLAMPGFVQKDRGTSFISETESFDWARLSADPPLFLSQRSSKDIKKDYPGAWNERQKLWDHQLIWLTEYFTQWVDGWEDSMNGSHPAFLDTVYPMTHIPRQAIITELVNYYREGELWGIDLNKDALTRPTVRDQVNQNRRNIASGTEKSLRAIINDVGGSRLDRIATYENIFWDEGIQGKLVTALIKAGMRQPRITPRPSVLKVNIPRPVARPGGDFYFDASVRAGFHALPTLGEIEESGGELSIKFRKESETNTRPKAVLLDDLYQLFGDFSDDYIEKNMLTYFKTKAVFTLSYKDQPAMKLVVEKPIYLVDFRRDDDTDDDTTPTAEPSDQDEQEPDQEQSGGSGRSTGNPEGENEDEENPCQGAKETTEGIQSEFDNFTTQLDEIVRETGEIDGKRKDIDVMIKEANRLAGEAYKAAGVVVSIKQKMETFTLKICQAAEKIKNTQNRSDRQQALIKLKNAFATLQKDVKTAREAFEKARAASLSAKVIFEKYKDLKKEIERLREEIEKVANGVDRIQTNVDETSESISRQPSEVVEAPSTAEGQTREEEEECKEEVTKRIEALGKDIAELNKKLGTTRIWSNAADVSAAEKKLIIAMKNAIKEADASASTAELYLDSIVDLASQAEACFDAVINIFVAEDTDSSGASPGAVGGSVVWNQISKKSNPEGYKTDLGEKTDSDTAIDRYSGSGTSLKNDYKWLNKRRGALKDMTFKFELQNLPKKFETDVTVNLNLQGKVTNNIGMPFAEARYAEIRIPDPENKDDIREDWFNEGFKLNSVFPELSQEYSFTPTDGLPDTFEFHFHLGKTAAYVVWVYSKNGSPDASINDEDSTEGTGGDGETDGTGGQSDAEVSSADPTLVDIPESVSDDIPVMVTPTTEADSDAVVSPAVDQSGTVNPDALNPDQQPEVAARIREWLSVARPPEAAVPGSNARYDEYGRVLGTVEGGIITQQGTPDFGTGASSEAKVWSALRKKVDSINNCTLEEYVVAKLQSQSTGHCRNRYTGLKNLKGMSLASVDQVAAEASAQYGLKFQKFIGSAAGSEEQEGKVERQNPDTNQYLKRGQTVKLYLYGSYQVPEILKIKVPDLSGEQYERAKNKLENIGLVAIARIREPANSASQELRVINQRPVPGDEIEPGREVELIIFGKFVPTLVPNVVNKKLDAARDILSNAGLVLDSNVRQAASSVSQELMVISQNPLPGMAVSPGQKVQLMIYGKYEPVTAIEPNSTDPGVTAGTATWVLIDSLINPSGYKGDFSKAEGSSTNIKIGSASRSRISWEYKWLDSRRVPVKDMTYNFDVVDLPQQISTTNPVKLKVNAMVTNNINKPFAEYVNAEIRLQGIKPGSREIHHYLKKSVRLDANDPKISREYQFKVPSDMPDEFQIHFHIGETAAYLVWTYRKQQASLIDAEGEGANRVPTLLGLSSSEVKRALLQAGFGKEDYVFRPGNTAPSANKDGKVESQQPAPNQSLQRGERIVIRIYSPWVGGVEVPNLKNMTYSAAKQELNRRGLYIDKRSAGPAPRTNLSQRIEKQDPSARKTVTDGYTIIVWVYSDYQMNSQEQVGSLNCSMYRNSAARWNNQTGQAECFCPQGYKWQGDNCVSSEANTQTKESPLCPSYAYTINRKLQKGDRDGLDSLARNAQAAGCTDPVIAQILTGGTTGGTSSSGGGDSNCNCVDSRGKRFGVMFGVACDSIEDPENDSRAIYGACGSSQSDNSLQSGSQRSNSSGGNGSGCGIIKFFRTAYARPDSRLSYIVFRLVPTDPRAPFREGYGVAGTPTHIEDICNSARACIAKLWQGAPFTVMSEHTNEAAADAAVRRLCPRPVVIQ
jgi:beta-lactam-binding protein with PASTA domain